MDFFLNQKKSIAMSTTGNEVVLQGGNLYNLVVISEVDLLLRFITFNNKFKEKKN